MLVFFDTTANPVDQPESQSWSRAAETVSALFFVIFIQLYWLLEWFDIDILVVSTKKYLENNSKMVVWLQRPLKDFVYNVMSSYYKYQVGFGYYLA